MDDFGDTMASRTVSKLGGLAQSENTEPGLFPERISTIHEDVVQGADIAFYCTVENGGKFFVKPDARLHPIRATEYLLSSLAVHLAINVPDFAVLEDRNGQTYFGSKTVYSSASMTDAKHILTTKTSNELNEPSWIGQFNSGLHAFDLFFMNDDRAANNFLLTEDGMRKSLYAIDFADADLLAINHQEIFPKTSNTIRQKNIYQRYHGFDRELAIKLVDNLGQVDQRFIQQVLEEIPEDWLDDSIRKSFNEAWNNGNLKARVKAIKSYFANGERI